MTIVGIICIILGCIMFVGCSAANKFDWSKLSSEKFEQKTFTTEETFQKIYVDEEFGMDITFLPSADGICKIEYEESKNVDCEISVEEGVLKINQNDNRRWYHMIGFNFYTPALTVYLPESENRALDIKAKTSDVTIPEDLSFENVKIDFSTGDITMSANVTGTLEIDVSTGDVTISNSNPTSVSITSSTGCITATAIHTTGDFYVKSSTGKQYLSDITCANANLISSTGYKEITSFTASDDLTVESGTGDQTYTNVTCANATLISSTGDKKITTMTVTGKLKVNSDTGDDLFSDIVCNTLNVTTTTGKQTYTDVSCGATTLTADTGKIHMTNLVSSDHLKIQTDTGDITFDRCDAVSMDIKAETGDVTGTFRTPKIIYADTDTGRINVSRATEGGLCDITTDTGDIEISFVG